MNAKFLTKGMREKGNGNVQPILNQHNIVQKPVIFQNISKPSPVLSDRSEFPSLNESSGKVSNNNSTGKTLKYSDKLKSHSLTKNQNSMAVEFQTTDNKRTSNVWCQNEDKSSFNKEVNQNFSQGNSDKSRFVGTNKVDINLNHSVPKKQLNKATKEYNLLNQQLIHGNKNELSKQKHHENSINSKGCTSCKTLVNSANINLTSKSNSQFSNSVKSDIKNELKEDKSDGLQCKEKQKKKRKSKVKRQAALQSGKITVLTPEVHSKILNQTSVLTSQNSKTVLTDINDDEEYPELGKPFLPSSQKGNYPKKDISETSKETVEKPPDGYSEHGLIVTKDVKEPPICGTSEKSAIEKKGKNDSKVTVHPNDPITISFYDILMNKNTKPKERDFKDATTIPNSIGLTKIKMKKDTCQPHNLLDSSSPMVKRGKERENPKPKKPSQLKKIILLDRKTRKEQLLHFKSNNPVEKDAIDNELVKKVNVEEIDDEACVIGIAEINSPNISVNEEIEIDDQTSMLLSDDSNVSASQLQETADQTFLTPSDNEDFQDEPVPKMKQFNLSDGEVVNEFSLTNISKEDLNAGDCLENSILSLSLDKICKNAKDNNVVSSAVAESVCSLEKSISVSYSPDSLLNSLINVKTSQNVDREKAAKVLLHTRNFREYCDHLISKDIDDAVFSLLDDLARFQDRLHQKDPVKARIKRRMINGVKEVKKFIKLRKLKCIIIAVDIENVEAQGGLNDVLNDIKVSAADHHIPYIFALSRKVLGKVTRKPVPVSCVGVLNYEGSETNFKKIVELQTQSKVDYNEIFSKLTLKLTDEEASNLLKAKAEAPETLCDIRTDILNDFFMKSKIDTCENDINIKSPDQMSELIDTMA